MGSDDAAAGPRDPRGARAGGAVRCEHSRELSRVVPTFRLSVAWLGRPISLGFLAPAGPALIGPCQCRSRISVARSPLAGRTASGRSARGGSPCPPTPRPTSSGRAAGPRRPPLPAPLAWSCIPPSRRCSSGRFRLRRGRCRVSWPCANPSLASGSSLASTGALSPVRSLVSTSQSLVCELSGPPCSLLHPLQLLAALLRHIHPHLGNPTPSERRWRGCVAPSRRHHADTRGSPGSSGRWTSVGRGSPAPRRIV